MKKIKWLTGIASLFLVLALSITSCSDDDPCADVTCPSGTVCSDGNCVTTDPCLNVTCGTDEVCSDGTCVSINVDPCADVNCPDGQVCSDGTCVDTDPCTGVTCDPGFSCVEGNCIQNTTVVGGFVETSTWTSDNIYILAGKVVVPEGVTLTIEAGTVIKGQEGVGTLASALIVARGGKIMANGTADAPIIMTSVLDDIQPGETSGTSLNPTQNGLWGGLIILGRAPISVEAGLESQIEGIPADDAFGAYGGDDPNDDSGVIRYVSVRHGGASIGEGNEINGITFGGVGNGTVVEHVEVVANQDDGIEMFGGTVNVNYALVWAQGDDAYDIDQAYSGTIDKFIYIAGPESDHAFEIDGPEGAANADGRYTLSNGYLMGLSDNGAEYADHRDGAQGTEMNCYFFNFDESRADFDIDDDASAANYLAGTLVFTGLEFNDSRPLSDVSHIDKATNLADADFDASFAMDNSISNGPSFNLDMTMFAWTFASDQGAIGQ